MLGVSACEKATAGLVNGVRFPRIGRHGLQIQPLEAAEGVRVPGAFAFYRRAATVRERLCESLVLVAAGVALMVEKERSAGVIGRSHRKASSALFDIFTNARGLDMTVLIACVLARWRAKEASQQQL
jgi:hypothetical protein